MGLLQNRDQAQDVVAFWYNAIIELVIKILKCSSLIILLKVRLLCILMTITCSKKISSNGLYFRPKHSKVG